VPSKEPVIGSTSGAVGLDRYGKVDGTSTQFDDRFLRLVDGQVQVDVGVDELERRQCSGHERGAGRGEGGQAEAPDLARAQGSQGLLGFADRSQDPRGVLAQK